MQTEENYAGESGPVKPGSAGQALQRVTCRIQCRAGSLRLVGSLTEVLDFLRAQCPGGRVAELTEVRG